MAHYYKVPSGWRVQIARKGRRLSRVFTTKSAAQQWATREEAAIIDGTASRWPAKTVADALKRYEREVSAVKKSGTAEVHRLRAFARDFPSLSGKIISEVTPADLAHWRDARLKKVSPGSVQRDVNLLRNVWTVAAREWGWLEASPWRSIKLPGDNPPRERLIRWSEARRLLRRCGYRTGVTPSSGIECVGWAFLVALRTALRAGEVMGLTGESVDLDRRVIRLDEHKTVGKVGRRLVPLTPQAVRLLKLLHKPGPLFTELAPASLDTLFRRMRDQALLSGFTFHDSRATALTHLSRRMDVLTLSRISGHKDLNTLLKSYYRESAEAISARLASSRPIPR